VLEHLQPDQAHEQQGEGDQHHRAGDRQATAKALQFGLGVTELHV